MKIVVDPKVPNTHDAEYELGRDREPTDKFELEELYKKGVVVRLRPNVLESDESIVGTLRHEIYELQSLERMLGEGAKMTTLDVRAQLKANRGDNIHGQAWDVSDMEVRIMREKPGSEKYNELRRRQIQLLYRLELQNYGVK